MHVDGISHTCTTNAKSTALALRISRDSMNSDDTSLNISNHNSQYCALI